MVRDLGIQMGLWGDTPYGKTYQEASQATEEQTSKQSSRSSSASQNQMPLMCLFLRKANGPTLDASMVWEQMESPFPWLTRYMTPNGGAYRSEENGCVSFAITPDGQQENCYLTLNIGEKPRVPNPTKLSDILEEMPDEKYRLSARACEGILRRAEKRGKELPKELHDALLRQTSNGSE